MTSSLTLTNLHGMHPPTIDFGAGVYLTDTGGMRYLDGCSGAMVANLGHGVTEIEDAIISQMRRVSYVFRSQFTNDASEDLAKRICRLRGSRACFFLNTGSDANEAAIRLAVHYWQEQGKPRKRRILSRRTSYHGVTMGALSVSGDFTRRSRFESFLFETPAVDNPHCKACPHGLDRSTCELRCAEDVEALIEMLGADTIAAFIFEPIVGATGGAIVPPAGYYERVRAICDAHDVLLIADEVITGVGRTGQWFGMSHWDAEPDITVLGKGLTAGYSPLSAVTFSQQIYDALSLGEGDTAYFGQTYSNNPVASAAGLAVLDYIEGNNILKNVQERGNQLQAGLAAIAASSSSIVEIRGKGLLQGIEFDPRLSTIGAAAEIVGLAKRLGLLLYPCRGSKRTPIGNSVLVAPPLVIDEDDVSILLEMVAAAVSEFDRSKLS